VLDVGAALRFAPGGASSAEDRLLAAMDDGASA